MTDNENYPQHSLFQERPTSEFSEKGRSLETAVRFSQLVDDIMTRMGGDTSSSSQILSEYIDGGEVRASIVRKVSDNGYTERAVGLLVVNDIDKNGEYLNLVYNEADPSVSFQYVPQIRESSAGAYESEEGSFDSPEMIYQMRNLFEDMGWTRKSDVN